MRVQCPWETSTRSSARHGCQPPLGQALLPALSGSTCMPATASTLSVGRPRRGVAASLSGGGSRRDAGAGRLVPGRLRECWRGARDGLAQRPLGRRQRRRGSDAGRAQPGGGCGRAPGEAKDHAASVQGPVATLRLPASPLACPRSPGFQCLVCVGVLSASRGCCQLNSSCSGQEAAGAGAAGPAGAAARGGIWGCEQMPGASVGEPELGRGDRRRGLQQRLAARPGPARGGPAGQLPEAHHGREGHPVSSTSPVRPIRFAQLSQRPCRFGRLPVCLRVACQADLPSAYDAPAAMAAQRHGWHEVAGGACEGFVGLVRGRRGPVATFACSRGLFRSSVASLHLTSARIRFATTQAPSWCRAHCRVVAM